MIQDVSSLEKAVNFSRSVCHRRLVVKSIQEKDVSRGARSQINEILQNSVVEHLTLCLLPLSLQNSMLKMLSNITSLNIDSLFFHPSYQVLIDLPHLKEVTCIKSEFFLTCIRKHQIESLKLTVITDKLFDFFAQCNRLKHLSVWGFLMRYDQGFGNFKLESLKLEPVVWDIIGELEWNLASCHNFLESQKHSLKELTINRCELFHACDEIVLFSLNEMSLQKMYVDYSINGGEIHKVNEQLTELRMDFVDNYVTENIIACCPNVQWLDMSIGNNIFTKILPAVAKHMPRLKHLIMSIDNPENLNAVEKLEFKNLDILDLVFLSEDIQHFITLLGWCPTISALRFNMPSSFIWQRQDFLKLLGNIPNVTEILSFGNFGFSPEVLDLFMQHLSALKLKKFKAVVLDPESFSHLIPKDLYSKLDFILSRAY